MRSPLVVTSILSAVVLAGGACSGDWSFALPAAQPGVPDTRYATACSAWAQSFCAYEALCTPSLSPWQSVAQCAARQVLSCELIAADPDVQFDENRVRECRYPTDCKSEVPNCWTQGRAPSGSPCLWGPACSSGICQGSYPYSSSLACGLCGTPPGQPCMASEACFTGSCGSSAAMPAVCAPFASAGDSCGAGLPACGTSLVCANSFSEGQTGQCEVERAPGQPCDSSIYCTSGACSAEDAAGTRVCAALAKAGEACGLNEPFCEPSLTCVFGSDTVGQCVDAPPVASGGICHVANSNLFSSCVGFGMCGGTCTPNVPGNLCCVPPAADGAFCGSVQGPRCLPPAQCVADRCVLPSLEECAL